MKMLRSAFTLLELVFVIVAIGIIAVAIIPRVDRYSGLSNAAFQVISDIRYTQHLAMNDEHFSINDNNWYKKRWQIIFCKTAYTNQKWAYTIFSDFASSATGNADQSEIAKNIVEPSKLMTGGSCSGGATALDYRKDTFVGTKELNIGTKYGITNVTFSSACDGANGTSKRIAFDHLGRPMQGDLANDSSAYISGSLIKYQCIITLTGADGESVELVMEPETGYIYIDI